MSGGDRICEDIYNQAKIITNRQWLMRNAKLFAQIEANKNERSFAAAPAFKTQIRHGLIPFLHYMFRPKVVKK